MSDDESKQPLKSRSAKFFAEIRDCCIPRIDRATVTTVGIQDGEIRHDRTGVLYRIANEHFILTAAHELRGIVAHDIPLYVSVNDPDVLPLPLADARFCSTEEDVRDVAAVWLPPDLATEVGEYKDFINHNQINFSANDSAGPLLFYGYPMDWAADLKSETHPQSVALAFAGHPYNKERHPTAHYNSDINIILQFERDAIRTPDGVKDHLPHPKGISGCGIWQIGDFEDKTIQPRLADTVTLVGIQHRWFPNYSYIQGTRIRYVLGFLLENYPNLERAMQIVYPT